MIRVFAAFLTLALASMAMPSTSQAESTRQRRYPTHVTATYYYLDGGTMANGRIKTNTSDIAAVTCNGGFLLGTQLRLTNPQNSRQLSVTAQDKMSCKKNKNPDRIDLTLAGAQILDFVDAGFTTVQVEVLYIPPQPVTFHKRR